jgi:hypothetical protein
MAVTLSTTAATAVLLTDRTVKLTSGTGVVVGMLVKMEQEWSTVTAIAADLVTITLGPRGILGSIAAPHKILSPVEVGLPTEFTVPTPAGNAVPIPYSTPAVVYYGAAGAIGLPDKDANVFLVAASAAAMTLVAPGTDRDGLTLTIQAAAAQAYTVTTPTATGFKNTTGTATFGGAIGDNMVIMASKGLWLPVSTINVTFA